MVIAEIGYGAVIAALVLAVYGSVVSGVGGYRGRANLVASAQRAALGIFALMTGCLLLLVYAFLTFDFSIRYVAKRLTRPKRRTTARGNWRPLPPSPW